MTVAELDEVQSAASTAHRQVLIAENYYYKPLTVWLRRAIARRALGAVVLIQVNAIKGQQTVGWRNDPSLAGGGSLFEGGIHWISLLANIGLTPTRIRASFSTAGSPQAAAANGSARTAVATIDYAEGAVATLSYSWDLPGPINGVRMSRIYGTDGVLRFETNGLFALEARRMRLAIPGLFDLAGYRAMMTDFVSSIEGNRPPAYTLELARRDLQLTADACASAAGTQ
jgi:predicted dehydrogenase